MPYIKYRERKPKNEGEFERLFAKHASEIFDEDSEYFDLKYKLSSETGTGSIPDGYVISFGNSPQVHVIEVELSSHSLSHIKSQIMDISVCMKNHAMQQVICKKIEDKIDKDEILKSKITRAIKPKSVHEFIATCFSNKPPIHIVIDKQLPKLEEALKEIRYPIKIVVIRAFDKKGVGPAAYALLIDITEALTPGKKAWMTRNKSAKKELKSNLIINLQRES